MKKNKGQLESSIIGQAIRDANLSGRIGLILCVIPGYPDNESYADILSYIDSREDVTALEMTYPASSSFSETINDTLIQANLQASNIVKTNSLDSFLSSNKASFVQFYRQSVDAFGFDTLLSKYAHIFQGAILEWREENILPYVESSYQAGLEYIQCIPVGTERERARNAASLVMPGGLIYVSCAATAGGTYPPESDILEFVKLLKKWRPDASIATAMGIRTDKDVRFMANIPEVDAVVIGTGFINAAKNGLPSVKEYLEEIGKALQVKRRD